jgi:DNA polymerase-1
VTHFRAPVRPAWSGKQWLESLGAWVYVGREAACDAGMEIIRRGVPVATDLEAEGLGAAGRNLKCVIFSPLPDGDCAVILDPRDAVQWDFARWMIDTAPELVFHYSCFDVPNLAMNRLIRPHHAAKIRDGLLTARLAEPDNLVSKNLASCASRYLGYTTDKDGMLTSAKAVGMRGKEQMYREFDLDRPVYIRGAAADAIVTARLDAPLRAAAYHRLTDHPYPEWGVVGDEAVRLIEREQRLNRMSLAKAIKGYRVDLEYLDRYNAQFAVQLNQKERMLQHLGIRPGVAQDLLAVLDAQGVIPANYPRTKKTDVLSGKKDDLAKLMHPLAREFVWHKEHLKIYDDYLTKARDLAVYDVNGDLRLHPTINYFGATTGRMSVGDPPLQQFPELARGVILFDGNGTSIDWSQIEPVTIAYVAGDTNIISMYENSTDDLYLIVGNVAHIGRKPAKTQTLGTLYGQGLDLTAAKLGVDTAEALRIKDAVFGTMPKVLEFTFKLRQIAKTYQLVPTVSGRIIPIPLGWYEGRQSVAAHKGVNYFVQGSAYDVLAEALIGIIDAGLSDAVYFPMHDEVICASEAAYDIRRIMQTPPERLIKHSGRVPVLKTDMLDLGERWAAA